MYRARCTGLGAQGWEHRAVSTMLVYRAGCTGLGAQGWVHRARSTGLGPQG